MLRIFGWLFGFGVFIAARRRSRSGAVYLNQVAANLPDYTVLKDYQPPVTTRVHAADGTLLAEYAQRAPAVPADRDHPAAAHPRLHLGRRQGFLQPPRHFDRRHHPRAARQHPGARQWRRLDPGRRLDHHPAGGQELLSDPRPDAATARSRKRSSPIRIDSHLLQGQDPRALPQRNLPRAELLRRRGGGAQLFRQGALPARSERDGLPRGPAEGAQQLPSVQAPAGGDRAAQLRARSDAGQWLHHQAASTTQAKAEALNVTPRRSGQRSSIRPSISPRKCAASWARCMAKTSSMAAA